MVEYIAETMQCILFLAAGAFNIKRICIETIPPDSSLPLELLHKKCVLDEVLCDYFEQ